MKFTLAVTFLTASASAFAPTTTTSRGVAAKTTTLNASLNGWVPDKSKFCYGLPGSLAPVGEFDPLGFTQGADVDKIKSYREAELQHVSNFGRIQCCFCHGDDRDDRNCFCVRECHDQFRQIYLVNDPSDSQLDKSCRSLHPSSAYYLLACLCILTLLEYLTSICHLLTLITAGACCHVGCDWFFGNRGTVGIPSSL